MILRLKQIFKLFFLKKYLINQEIKKNPQKIFQIFDFSQRTKAT